MPLPAAQTACVDNRGNHQDQEVGTLQRPVRIQQPGIGEGGEWEKNETQQGQKQRVIRVLQIVRSEEQPRQNQTRESQHDKQQEARHIACIVAELHALAPYPYALVESNLRMNFPQRTVLIVDDDRQILGLVERMLRPQGVTVLSARRPSEALRIFEGQPVHVLISDVMMPEMDGGKLAERLLKLQPEARVLLISGQAKEPAVVRFPNVRFLRKPFFPSVLLQNLRELLEQA
jgi:CheY-like chemotaxis protein